MPLINCEVSLFSKTFFLVSQVLSFRHTKQTSKNVADTTFKVVKSREDSGLLLKGVSRTIQNEAKKQKGGFLSMLLGTLSASLSGNISAGKEVEKRAGERVIRAGYGNKKGRKATKKT